MTTQTIPKAGTWVIDPSHSQIEITARHLMVSKVRGSFQTFSGAVTIGGTPEESAVEVTIDAASVNTGAEDRDGHLRSGDFLDVEAYPTITFQSTSIERNGSAYRLIGNLTLRGVTKPLTLDMDYLGTVAQTQWAMRRRSSTPPVSFDREDWGLTWNVPLEAGGVLVSKKFQIEIAPPGFPSLTNETTQTRAYGGKLRLPPLS